MTEEDWEKVETDLWIPEKEGDSVEGVFIAVEKEVGENKSNLYTIETPDAKQIGVWGSKVLDGKLLSLKPGQEVKIVFLGVKKPEGKREWKDFDVFKKPMKE